MLNKILLFTVILVTIGCAVSRPLVNGGSVPAPVTPGTDLVNLGRTLVWIGGITAVAGVVTLVFGFARGISIFAIEAGIATVLCGVSCIWLGQNLWAVWVTVVITALAWAYLHRDKLRGWLGSRKETP